MRSFLYFLAFLLSQEAVADTLIVTDVKVEAEAFSPAAAREKAFAEAHKLAFLKLIEENYPASIVFPPPEPMLAGMVTTFSVDREKTTPKRYTGAFTFHFDEAQVKAWIERRPSSPADLSTTPSLPAGPLLSITTFYGSFQEWKKIKEILQRECSTFKMLSLSPTQAEIQVNSEKGTDFLKNGLHKEGWALSPQGSGWTLSHD